MTFDGFGDNINAVIQAFNCHPMIKKLSFTDTLCIDAIDFFGIFLLSPSRCFMCKHKLSAALDGVAESMSSNTCLEEFTLQMNSFEQGINHNIAIPQQVQDVLAQNRCHCKAANSRKVTIDAIGLMLQDMAMEHPSRPMAKLSPILELVWQLHAMLVPAKKDTFPKPPKWMWKKVQREESSQV